MDEYVVASDITNKHNEEYAEAKVLPGGDSGAPEDMAVYTSAHYEETKDQDTEESYHPEVNGYALGDHEIPVAWFIDKGNTQKTPEYGRKMNLYVKNIDKNIWRIIYKEIDAPYV